MLIHPMQAELDRLRRRELRETLRRQRLVARGRPSRSIGRVVGRSMIRIGSRLAADPMPEAARSR
ncbi:hypothetical protein BH24CHL5_BH24CHL5_00210 [soil metagenome]